MCAVIEFEGSKAIFIMSNKESSISPCVWTECAILYNGKGLIRAFYECRYCASEAVRKLTNWSYIAKCSIERFDNIISK